MTKNNFEFNNLNPSATILRCLDPMVVEKPRSPIHVHTYGSETPFFWGLTQGKLMATTCQNSHCVPSGKKGYYYLPPRIYCPDCLEKMAWNDITERARKKAKIHTHITVDHPGAFNRVSMPCELISVEIEGVTTVLMSQLIGGKPKIDMPIEPVFNTAKPTFTILDLSWKPRSS